MPVQSEGENRPRAKVIQEQVRQYVYEESWDRVPTNIYYPKDVSVISDGETVYHKCVQTHFVWLGIPKPFFNWRLRRTLDRANRKAAKLNKG